jgi:hypothetical protein
MAAHPQTMNLESRAQATQLRVGVVALAVALAIGAALSKSGASPLLRVVAFVPFFFAAYGILAALYRTCGFTAIAGRRHTNQGTERVIDRDELREQRRIGLRVLAAGFALATVATIALVAS